MKRKEQKLIRLAALASAAIAVQTATQTARADDPLRISEIFHDGPGADVGTVGGQPFAHIYIEIRGTPNTVLDNKFLIFLESENTPDGNGDPNPTGNVDGIFNLTGMHIGSNGFLMLLPNGFDRTTASIRKGTQVYQNTVGLGFGDSGASTIGYRSSNGGGDLENAAYSAFLLDKGTGTAPTVNQHLDTDKNGALDSTLTLGWTIHDSIGEAEANEAPYAYAKTFFSGTQATVISPGSTNVVTSMVQTVGGSPIALEPEFVQRYGSSTGSLASDWMMANITNNTASGFSQANFAQNGFPVSADPHGRNPAQPGQAVRGLSNTNAVQNVSTSAAPEGTIIQNTLGRPNWPVPDGDLSQDLSVNQADLNIVVGHWHQTDASQLGYWLFGDAAGDVSGLGGDGTVNKADLDWVMTRWPAFASAGFTVPNFGALEGDVNLDGIVDIVDLRVLAQHWRQHGLGYEFADWDYNGYVDVADLYLMAQNYLDGYAALGPAMASMGIDVSVVPEPTALGLLILVPVFLSRRRRIR